jgi:hypothetical protein
MAENDRLRELLLVELSNIHLFCKLLKYPMVHENLLKIFKVRNLAFALLMSFFISYFCALLMDGRVVDVVDACELSSLVKAKKRNRASATTTSSDRAVESRMGYLHTYM